MGEAVGFHATEFHEERLDAQDVPWSESGCRFAVEGVGFGGLGEVGEEEEEDKSRGC